MTLTGAVAKTISPSGLIAVVATCGLLLSACGSSNSSSKAAATPSPSPAKLITSVDACTLVTAADASAATGVTVTDIGASSGAATPGACLYGSADFTTSVIVEAQVYPSASAAAAISPEKLAAGLKGTGVTGTAKVVTGIGDKAVEYTYTSSGTGGSMIFAFKSNVVIIIIVTPSSDATAVENLARTAVSHLPSS
jgi:hypothetical protein